LSTRQEVNTFIIKREDRAVDPVTIISEGLGIGRLPDCELSLNHPTVSRLHAGIRRVEGRFYIFHLSPSNSTTLNGSLVEEKAALADGDVVQIGPFFLFLEIKGDTFSVRVRYQTAVRIGDAEVPTENAPSIPGAPATADAHGAAGHGAAAGAGINAAAMDVFWEKRKREAGKIARPSPLRPRPLAPKLGKARFNWRPTRDLVRPWPFSIFTWGIVVVGLLSVVAAFRLHLGLLACAHLQPARALHDAINSGHRA
jgi:pSer/pThr/pTyr-binding forkhead associated (FHA) protein